MLSLAIGNQKAERKELNLMTIQHTLRLKNLGIDTYKEAVVYMRKDCPICRSEGFEAQARIRITLNDETIIATLNTIESELLNSDEASLSTYAWELLQAKAGDTIHLAHPLPLESQNFILNKVNGMKLTAQEFKRIIKDLMAGYLSDIYIAAFLTACANGRMSKEEVFNLTQAMINTGRRLSWPDGFVVDKHCVGGLPGNRTSLIIIPIVTEFGLMMPKTSSRAITSPAGTADTMSVLAPVNLSLATMRQVVEQEKGCIVWGDSVSLSPADDLFIRIENVLELDSEGQLIASVLSKKVAAGSSHIVIDIPIGPTAKVKSLSMAKTLKKYFEAVAKKLAVKLKVVFSDGSQPVGRGIGPALEAKDVLAVLQGNPDAPQDLRDRALTLAGHVLEFSPEVKKGSGKRIATEILDSGRALKKFTAICQAQGGMLTPPTAPYTLPILATQAGVVTEINNQYISMVAKLAGAPKSKAAGVELLTPLGTQVSMQQPLFIIHAATEGELHYAANYVKQGHIIIGINGK